MASGGVTPSAEEKARKEKSLLASYYAANTDGDEQPTVSKSATAPPG